MCESHDVASQSSMILNAGRIQSSYRLPLVAQTGEVTDPAPVGNDVESPPVILTMVDRSCSANRSSFPRASLPQTTARTRTDRWFLQRLSGSPRGQQLETGSAQR